MGWIMNRKGFVRKASWRRFLVLGCKGGGEREVGGTQSLQFLP